MDKKGILHFFARFLVFSGVVFGIIGGGVYAYVYGPKEFIYQDGDWDNVRYAPPFVPGSLNVLFDPHSHSIYGDGGLTLDQNLQWHIAMGYNSCVVSDQLGKYPNVWEGMREARQIARQKYNDSIKVILGVEISTYRGHFNLLIPPNAENYEQTIFYYGNYPTDEQIKTTITATHNLGGIVIVDHLPWSLKYMPTHPTRQQLYEWGVDYIEVIGADGLDVDSKTFCQTTGMGQIAAAGMHEPTDKVHGWTLLKPNVFTEDAIFSELKTNHTELIFVGEGAPYNVQHLPNWAYFAMRPLIQIGDLIEDYDPSGGNLDWIGFTILLIYVYGGFTLMEVGRWVYPRLRSWVKLKRSPISSVNNAKVKNP